MPFGPEFVQPALRLEPYLAAAGQAPKHILAATFEGWLECDPTQVGFSHSAYCRMRECEGGHEVVKIQSVESVDLVSTPATTRGLFESEGSLDPIMTEPAPEGLDAAVSALLAAILADKAMSMDEKRKKVLVALKLMEEGRRAGVGQLRGYDLNVLTISDLHCPWHHPCAVDFLADLAHARLHQHPTVPDFHGRRLNRPFKPEGRVAG